MIETRQISRGSRGEKSLSVASRAGALAKEWTSASARARRVVSEATATGPSADAVACARTAAPTRVLAAALAIVLTFALSLLPTVPAQATTPTPTASAEDILITGYSITKGSTAHYTGALHKNDRFTLILNVSDTRPFLSAYTSSNPPSPGARLNTSSFTIADQSAIKITNITPLKTDGWTYDITFVNLTYTGAGQDFRTDIFYPTTDGAPLFSYSQTISQSIPWTEPPSEPTLDPASEMPATTSATVKGTGFVIESYDSGSEAIYAGKPFTLKLTWLATKGASALENVTVSLTPSQELTLAKGANLIYVGTVSPGAKIPITYELLPGAATNEGSYAITIDIKGIDATSGSEIGAQASVTIPVLQPERFSILKSSLPTELTLGTSSDTNYGSITLVNQGRTPASNAFLEVVGKGIEIEGGKQYLGTVNGGEQKTTDFSFTASEQGTIKAKVRITYENARGEAREITQDFTVNVREAELEPTQPMGEMEEIDGAAKTGFPWWIVVLLALTAIVVLIVGLMAWNKNRTAAQQAKLLADDWENEDG